MDEKLKSKILLVVIVLMVSFLLMALSSHQSIGHIKRDLDQERYKRMVAEENLNKASGKISTLETELSNTKDKIQSVQAILQEGKSETSDLKTQLERVTKAKEILEKKIEELKSTAASAPAVPAQIQAVPTAPAP